MLWRNLEGIGEIVPFMSWNAHTYATLFIEFTAINGQMVGFRVFHGGCRSMFV